MSSLLKVSFQLNHQFISFYFSLGDIRNDDDINSALKLCTNETGDPQLNVLVNCAGVANAFKIYNFINKKPHRLQDFSDVVNINIIGTFNVIRLAVPLLAQNPINESGKSV